MRLLPLMADGVQWKDWRFSTVGWLLQECKQFEALLQKIEKLKTEPEEPPEGSPMLIVGKELTTEEKLCCEELYALLSQKTKDGPKMIVRNLETFDSHPGGSGAVSPREGSRGADRGTSN